MLKKLQSTFVVFIALAAFVCPAQKQKQLKRELSHLPPAVQETVRGQLGDGRLDSIDKDSEDGEVSYDVEFVRNGKERGFTVGSEGELQELEVFSNELPKAVQQTIQKQVGSGILGEIEKSSEDGEPSYDVEMTRDGKTRNFTVGARGELVDIEVFLSELPASVQTAMQKQAGEDKLGEITKCFDDEGGTFDVEVAGARQNRTLSFDTQGQLLSTEEDVEISNTPESVQKQIKVVVGAGKLLGISKVTEDDGVSYDVGIGNGGDEKTVSISSDGKVMPDEGSK